MRRLFTLLLAVCTMAVVCAEIRSVDDAQQQAQIFLQSATPQGLKRMPAKGNLSLAATIQQPAQNIPALYAFNTGEQGFVLVAADDRAKTILGYSDEGSFDLNNIPANLKFWLEMYADELQRIPANYKPEHTASKAKYKPVEPLLGETRWNQNYPFNMYTPKKATGTTGMPTGCVATAAAQIMYYWKYPVHGVGSHTNESDSALTADFEHTTYEWDNMNSFYHTTPEQQSAVATLLYHVGIAVDMKYGNDGSSASSKKLMKALHTYFAYDAGIRCLNKECMQTVDMVSQMANELAQARPIYMDGSKNMQSGHAFVCDGIREDGYLHINWGWGGTGNGYFALSVLEPDAEGIGGSKEAGGTGYSEYDCNAFIGIQPEKGGYDVPLLTVNSMGFNTTKRRFAKNESIVFSYNRLFNIGFYDVVFKPAIVVWKGSELVTSFTWNEIDLKPNYGISFSTYFELSKLPVGNYQMQFAAKANGYQGFVPLRYPGLGEYREDVTVTADSVFFGDRDYVFNIRMKKSTNCTLNGSEGFELNWDEPQNASYSYGCDTLRLQADGWYAATIHAHGPCIAARLYQIYDIASKQRTQNYAGYIHGDACFILQTDTVVSGNYYTLKHYIVPYDGDDCPSQFSYDAPTPMPEPIPDDTAWVTLTTSNTHGTISGAGKYIRGSALFMTATPQEGYKFVCWTDKSTDNPKMIILDKDTVVTAVFAELTAADSTFNISTNAEHGYITGGGQYPAYEFVTLTAVPDEGYVFSHWNDNVTDNPRKIFLSQDTTFTAIFNQIPDTSTIIVKAKMPSDWGSTISLWVWPDGGSGQWVTPTVEGEWQIFTQQGSELNIIYVNGTNWNGDNNQTVDIHLTESACIQIGEYNYGAKRTYSHIDCSAPVLPKTYTITASAVNGTVTGGGTYEEGTTITLTATPDEGYIFTKWGDGNADNPRTIVVTEDAEYIAYFVLKPAPSESITVKAKMPSDWGSTISVWVWPTGGNGQWVTPTVEGEWQVFTQQGSELNIIYVNGTNWNGDNNQTVDICLTASACLQIGEYYFGSKRGYTNVDCPSVISQPVTVSTSAEHGLVLGGGNYEKGSAVTLTAVPDEGYEFTQWSDENTENPRTVIADADATYTAMFAAREFTLTVVSSDDNMGIVTGGGTYQYGSEATISAIAKSGYEFTGWSDNNVDNPRTITVTGDATYTAIFTEIINALEDADASSSNVRKIFLNGHICILRDGKVYNMLGALVE